MAILPDDVKVYVSQAIKTCDSRIASLGIIESSTAEEPQIKTEATEAKSAYTAIRTALLNIYSL